MKQSPHTRPEAPPAKSGGSTTAKSSPQGAFSPIIYDYLKKYQDDPTSRIFAPLAEAYRKSGLIDQAIEIARDGLQHHPQFTGGRVALARALFDKKHYNEVVEELTPVIREVPDNLVAQKLLAESCLMLGRNTEALSAYKMLLYFQPQDRETAKMVKELEVQAYERGGLVVHQDAAPPKGQFKLKSTRDTFGADEDLQKYNVIGQVEVLTRLLQRIERYRSSP